jgi:hypothetical protein
MFGYLETRGHLDAGTGPAVGLQEEMQVALKAQTPAVLKGLEESAREMNILIFSHPWVTKLIHGQCKMHGLNVTETGFEDPLCSHT